MMINSNLNLLVKLFIGPDSDNDWRTKICIIYVLRSTSQSQSNNCLSKIEKIFQPSSGNIGCNHLHHQDHQDQDHHLGRLNAKLFMLHNINSQPFHLNKKGFSPSSMTSSSISSTSLTSSSSSTSTSLTSPQARHTPPSSSSPFSSSSSPPPRRSGQRYQEVSCSQQI